MPTPDVETAHAHFWALAEALLAAPAISEGTMMGFPCLRIEGQFFASVEHKGSRLVVKLPRTRVSELVEQGLGEPFAPAGRTFKEWIAIPYALAETWSTRMDEARAFVGV